MSSIYKVGAAVVCPEASKYGDKGNMPGTIQNFRLGTAVPFIKWDDGVEGYMKPQHLITTDKYEQLHNAGFTDVQIAEYVRAFNGNIYN
jgi:hypothetical protein